jgi:diguanylate cyclase (GGDEF)-like protein
MRSYNTRLTVLLSIVATTGIVYMSTSWYSYLLTLGMPSVAAMLIAILSFIVLISPIPVLITSSFALSDAATRDSLTGLLNRASFNDAFAGLIAASTKSNTQFHLLMIDLNKFKQINDSLGHIVGDLVLKDVATKLTHSIRDVDVLARLGGDEFAILIPDSGDGKTHETVIQRIVKNVNSSTKVDGHHLYITSSVATFPATGKTMVDLMRCADIAMYSSKRTQKDFCMYRHEDDNANTLDLQMLGELRNAIDDGDCELWFQPKKNLKTGSIDAAECLIRWRHPVRGIINPGSFIALAESSGLIKYVTQFVVREATASYKKLVDAGHDLSLSINVSPIDVVDPTIMTTIIKSVVKAEMPPSKLVLEVTETAIMADPNAVFKVLVALESLGIKLSIDDFGTGHSSLLYLKNFPIHEVKLDRSFIIDIQTNEEGYNIVKSTIDLSHTLKAITVAEGVETPEIETMLGELNCDYVQGYFIAGAMPLPEFVIWLNNYKERHVQ